MINAVVPRVTGGGCIVVKDELYYLGGFVSIPNIDVSEINKNLCKLDLKKGFKVISNTVEWESYSSINPPVTAHGPKEWYKEYIIKELYKPNDKSNASIDIGIDGYTPYFYILQDEFNLNKLYISGYLSKELPSIRVKLSDIQSKEMISIYKVKEGYYVLQLFTKDDKIYFLEYSKDNANNTGFIDIIYELNLMTNEVKKHNIKLRDGFYKHVLKSEQATYFVICNHKPEPNVYQVQFKPLGFRKSEKTSITNSNRSCLVIYNKIVINSFDFTILDNKDSNKLQSMSQIQVLNATNWKLLEGLPSSIGENSYTLNKDNSGLYIGIIMGVIRLIMSTSTAIVFKLYKYKLKKEKPPSLIIQPIAIEPTDISDTNTTFYDTGIFTYCQKIDNANTVLPINYKFNSKEYKNKSENF
ncbi:hypothetical protein K502DRAFT_366407 [Neoconidiobolus thromboides FSU 785]|nr:hypothetical protein K502DRAFT_366407 [Neoconidiobolus thromboides FSU 785]